MTKQWKLINDLMNLLLFSINFAKLPIAVEIPARACNSARAESDQSKLEKGDPTFTLEKSL